MISFVFFFSSSTYDRRKYQISTVEMIKELGLSYKTVKNKEGFSWLYHDEAVVKKETRGLQEDI